MKEQLVFLILPQNIKDYTIHHILIDVDIRRLVGILGTPPGRYIFSSKNKFYSDL